jgi:transcriptional regulator with XRE-family HTH domain
MQGVLSMGSGDSYAAELAGFRVGFGANVRRLRLSGEGACSQEALAERARLHRTEISKIERGDVEPRLSTLVILAEALGSTPNDLVAGLDVPVQRKPPPR